ncbi:HD domain-containing phosphohydrolase [Streptomyces sp. NPDC089799]|uniref:HD-GYP domain-containing protein n=1 Tax=Streptomyces sp. NPDC089799 TaxID=3155066 RepID=UPI0034337D7F
MRGLPPGARFFLCCAVAGSVACLLPALTGAAAVPWPAAALLCALSLVCERAKACRLLGSRVPEHMGSFFPVALAAVFLLPPPAAALAVLPGALAGKVEQRPAGVRRVWQAARQSMAAWAAGGVFGLLGGPAALGGPGGSGGSVASVAGGGSGPPEFPGVMLPAAAAALVLCLVLAALDGAILAVAERHPVATAWRTPLARSVVPHLVHAPAALMMAVLWRSPYGPPAALAVLLPVGISCWVFAQYHHERGAHQATIRALVQAVDIKDRYTRGHGERVGQASAMIARELGMSADRVETVRIAGILHDVGKLGVPTRLLCKDGPLTPEERRTIELHPEYGHEMVRGIGFLGEARAAILHHHERVDGGGYPYGLTGERIPVAARVVAVADAFDAMTSTRSYSRARPVPVALAELERCAGAQFDPEMVLALTTAVRRDGWHPVVTSDVPGPPPLNALPAQGGEAAGRAHSGSVRAGGRAGATGHTGAAGGAGDAGPPGPDGPAGEGGGSDRTRRTGRTGTR